MNSQSYRTLIKQQRSRIKIQTPLGPDTFNVREVKVQERIDEPFEITIDVVSPQHNIDYHQLVGQGVGLTAYFHGDPERYFHGQVKNFDTIETSHNEDTDVTRYRFTLVPQFWFTKLTMDCKVFQKKSVLDIVQEILGENGVAFSTRVQSAGMTPREYCIQYNETDFNFVSRLLEEEGIFYFFEFSSGAHTMVLADRFDSLSPAPGAATLETMNSKLRQYIPNKVYSLNPNSQVTSRDYTQRDYNMTTASTLLQSMQKGAPQSMEQFGEMYHYYGQFDHEDIPQQGRLELLTKIRLDAIESQKAHLVGRTSSPYLGVGYKFHLTKHSDPKRNRGYVVRAVAHLYTIGEEAVVSDQDYYMNTIEVYEDDISYRPKKDTPKPRIDSIQSAVVTGPPGEEIWTDTYGRIRVQFHWDRLGPKTEKSSCWIRVLQGWAGNDWGVLFTPRIGMEVMVTFVDGDPNRPIVTGCLYNSDHMPPYLPERVTGQMMPSKSTYKTNTTKGGGGFNEYRYEDLKGEEQVYIRGEKDYDKYIRQTMTLHVESGSVWESVDQGDRDVALYGGGSAVPKTTPVGQEHPVGAGDDYLEVTTGNRSTTFLSEFGAITDSLHIVEGDRAEQIDTGNRFRINQIGNVSEFIDLGNHGELIVTGNKNTSITTGDFGTDIVTGDYGVHVNTGDQIYNIQVGNHYTQISTGNQKTLVEVGDIAQQIITGNRGTTINMGNKMTHLMCGNDTLQLDLGNQIIFVNGNVYEHVTNNYFNQTDMNYSMIIGGNLEIIVAGNIDIMAGMNINVTAGGNIAVESLGSTTMMAAGPMTFMTAETMLSVSLSAMVCLTETEFNATALDTWSGISIESILLMYGNDITFYGNEAAEMIGGVTAIVASGEFSALLSGGLDLVAASEVVIAGAG